MPLLLPDDVPIAVSHPSCLTGLGTETEIPGVRRTSAFAFRELEGDVASVWCRVNYRAYRSAWHKAAAHGLVSPLSEWGSDIDLDHLLSRHAARNHGLQAWFIRLHPVYREINRSAGASREKSVREIFQLLVRKGGIVFASELHMLKVLGHPVGTAADPTILFDG
jgi:hypothetical protein